MNPEIGDDESPSPHDSFTKIFHVIEQSEDLIHQTNELAVRIAQSGFLTRSMLLGPVIATVSRTHADGTPLPPMVYRSALYAPLGLGVSASWAPDSMDGKPWATRRVKGVLAFTRFDNCPFLWRFLLVKRHLDHLDYLTQVMRGLIRKRLRTILDDDRPASREQSGASVMNEKQKHGMSVNRLLMLMARLVSVSRLNNLMKRNKKGDMESGGS